jgi:hypothetical protein
MMSESVKLLSLKVLSSYIVFLLLCCAAGVFFVFPTGIAAGNFAPVSPTPTPAKKATLTGTTKPGAPMARPASTPAAEVQKVIVSTTAARVRSEASTASAELRRMKLGTILSVVDKTAGAAPWYKVQLPPGSKISTGWMSSTVASSFDQSRAETIYRQIANKNFKATGMSFADSAEVYEFLSEVTPEIKNSEAAAEFGLKRLQSLAAALNGIPMMKSEEKLYKDFTAAHDKEIVYSDPAGQWFVRADLFWDLRKKYPKSTLAEEIAWAAARTNLPGECEGYVVCYLYLIRETDGEYLTLHPYGKHSAEALKNIHTYLQPIVSDLKEKKIYTGPTDLSDRADYNRYLADLRTIVSKLSLVDKDKPLRQISLLAEAYK